MGLSRVRIEIDLHEVTVWIRAEVIGERLRDERACDRNPIVPHSFVQFAARGGGFDEESEVEPLGEAIAARPLEVDLETGGRA